MREIQVTRYHALGLPGSCPDGSHVKVNVRNQVLASHEQIALHIPVCMALSSIVFFLRM